MKKELFFEQIRSRVTLRHGSRAALLFECELPVGDTSLSHHTQELAAALRAHAERVYLPVAAAELARLAGVGRGYDFIPHRVQFCAKAHPARGRVQLELTLRYTTGKQTQLLQNVRHWWSAEGEYRLR